MSVRLFRVGAGRAWHYRFQVAGVRIQRSTRETVKGRAEKVADRAYQDAVVRANGGQPVPTLRELIAAWLEIHAPIRSARHIGSVKALAKLHLYTLGDKPVNAITTSDIEMARNAHLESHAPSSTNHWLRLMKLIGMWAVKREIIPALPWKVRMLKVQRKPRPMLPVDVANTWFRAVDKTARSPAVGTAVRMMFGLGLRESESSSARWEWIDWERATYTPGITKGREAKPVPMADWLIAHLAPLRRESGLIAARRDGRPLPAGFSRNAMKRANAECQLVGITPHRLRGTFATMLSEAGVPLQTIQEVMRHKHPMTTIGYLEPNLDTAARAVNEIGRKIGNDWRKNGETAT